MLKRICYIYASFQKLHINIHSMLFNTALIKRYTQQMCPDIASFCMNSKNTFKTRIKRG